MNEDGYDSADDFSVDPKLAALSPTASADGSKSVDRQATPVAGLPLPPLSPTARAASLTPSVSKPKPLPPLPVRTTGEWLARHPGYQLPQSPHGVQSPQVQSPGGMTNAVRQFCSQDKMTNGGSPSYSVLPAATTASTAAVLPGIGVAGASSTGNQDATGKHPEVDLSAKETAEPLRSTTPADNAQSAPETSQAATAAAPARGTPEKPIRDHKPNYPAWGVDLLRAELKRRAKGGHKIKFGPSSEDVENRLSQARRPRLEHMLRTWDAWMENEGLSPLWASSPLVTPQKSHKAQNSKKGGNDDGNTTTDHIRPSELPRLIAIVFSETFWGEVCGSEQGSDDRLAGKGESNVRGDRHPIFRRIAKAFADPAWKDNGRPLSNPYTHEDEYDDDPLFAPELDKLRDALSEVDYIEPAKRWRDQWENEDGDIDLVSAGVRVAGWWKKLRKELRTARANEDQSGGGGMHSWRFCGNRLSNQLMIDWLEVRGGVEGNAFSKQYLEVELDEESGAGFNSLDHDEGLLSTDSEEDEELVINRSRKRKSRGGGDDSYRGAKKSVQDVIENSASDFQGIVKGMLACMEKTAEGFSAVTVTVEVPEDIGLGMQRFDEAGLLVDKLEKVLAELENDPSCTQGKLERAKERLDAAVKTYQKLKAAHFKTLAK